MKTTTAILGKVLALLMVLILTINYSCTKRDDDDNQDGHFTYIGTIDHWCGYLIALEMDDVEVGSSSFIKPINLDSTFEIHGLKVKVTFSYINEKQIDCRGGFIGIPEKVEIIKIKKL